MPVVPIVAIDIPAEVAPDLASTTLRTCNLALGNGHCVAWDANVSSVGTKWLAHVAADVTSPQQLSIELRDALPRSKRTTYSRQLTFEASDAAAHRWSTVGVVIAALVISAESGGESTVSDPSRSPSPDAESGDSGSTAAVPATSRNKKAAKKPTESSDPAANASRPLSLRLELGAIAGPSLAGFAPRYGFGFRPSLELTRSVFVWAQASGSRAEDELVITWWSGAAGLGMAVTIVPKRLAIEGRAGLLREQLRFDVTDAEGASASEARWRTGAVFGIDGLLNLTDSLGWYVAADVMLASPRVRIRALGNQVGETPTAGLLVGSGLRWRIPIGS